MTGNKLYAELYNYATLEAAYEAAFMFLGEIPENTEEWLINLQNHLMWHSYDSGENPDMDVVVLSAIEILMKHHGIGRADAGDEIGKIIDDFTLN